MGLEGVGCLVSRSDRWPGRRAVRLRRWCGTGSWLHASVYAVTWGQNQTALLYPGRAPRHQPRRKISGEQRVYDDLNNPYYVKGRVVPAATSAFGSATGVSMRVSPTSIALRFAAGNVDMYKLMRQDVLSAPDAPQLEGRQWWHGSSGKTVIYANRGVLQALTHLATNKGSSDNFSSVMDARWNPAGKEVMTYRISRSARPDSLINAEARVVTWRLRRTANDYGSYRAVFFGSAQTGHHCTSMNVFDSGCDRHAYQRNCAACSAISARAIPLPLRISAVNVVQ